MKIAYTLSFDSKDAIVDLYNNIFYDEIEEAIKARKEIYEDDPLISVYKITVEKI